jgi:branched-chain amino acid aminotransferase
MSEGKYILVDGTFVPADEYRLTAIEAQSLLFSERIRAVRTNFPFFIETLELIKLKFLIFNQSFPEFIDRNGAGLRRQLERTLTKNKFFLGAVFTLSFRLLGSKVHYTIQTEKLEQVDYELNEKGLFLGVFDKIQKASNTLSNLSMGAEVCWKIANCHLNDSGCDQFLIVNTENHILEVPSSNIYLINGNSVRGASCENGAYLDISQSILLEIFAQLKLNYSEEVPITIQDVRMAEEIMVVNAVDGIKWIVGFEGKRYFNNTIRKISDLFSRSLLVK